MKNLKTWKLTVTYGQKGWWTPLVPRENGATRIRTERLLLPLNMPMGSSRRQCQRGYGQNLRWLCIRWGAKCDNCLIHGLSSNVTSQLHTYLQCLGALKHSQKLELFMSLNCLPMGSSPLTFLFKVYGVINKMCSSHPPLCAETWTSHSNHIQAHLEVPWGQLQLNDISNQELLKVQW